MYAKTITYTDYNGNERTEEFYFNFSTAELAEMELSTKGGLEGEIKYIANEQDGAKIVEWFKKIILKSVGKKSPDGKRFIKSKEISDEFAQTEAYSQLIMELAFDAEKGAEFINNIVPNVPNDKKPQISDTVLSKA